MKNKKILIVAATHGDEQIGIKVQDEIKKIPIKNGQVDFLIANERALAEKQRYIDSDLNRVFPGLKDGNHEERLAYSLSEKIKDYDVVIDIHSTTSELKDALIVTKLDSETKKIIKVVNPKYLLYMKISENTALISGAKIGLAFEYGKDDDAKALESIVGDIKKILFYLHIIEDNESNRDFSTQAFEINKSFPKKDDSSLDSNIENYKLVKKGEIVGYSNEEPIISEEDFYPVLFGEKNYETMFGFVGKKIELD